VGARAVKAPVLGTRAARLRHPPFQCFTGAKHSHPSVVRGQARLLSKRLHRCAGHLNRFEGLGVFRLQGRREAGHAGANLRLHLLGGCLVGIELSCECFVRPVSGASPPKLIDGGISKAAIEPWNDCFVRGRLVRPRDDLRKRVLQDVLGKRTISDTALQIAQERAVILEEDGNWSRVSFRLHVSMIAPGVKTSRLGPVGWIPQYDVRMRVRAAVMALSVAALGCDEPNSPSSPTNPSGSTTATVRLVFLGPTARRADLPASALDCVNGVGATHTHPSWRSFASIPLQAVPPERYEIVFTDVPVNSRVSFRVNDQNACDENPTGAVTRGVLLNGVQLNQNATTPGNGDEPGYAFTISSNGTISQ
jgi:hypothetical protein